MKKFIPVLYKWYFQIYAKNADGEYDDMKVWTAAYTEEEARRNICREYKTISPELLTITDYEG